MKFSIQINRSRHHPVKEDDSAFYFIQHRYSNHIIFKDITSLMYINKSIQV